MTAEDAEDKRAAEETFSLVMVSLFRLHLSVASGATPPFSLLSSSAIRFALHKIWTTWSLCPCQDSVYAILSPCFAAVLDQPLLIMTEIVSIASDFLSAWQTSGQPTHRRWHLHLHPQSRHLILKMESRHRGGY